MRKNYVLDTNILLSDTDLIFNSFDEHNIIIPLPVIEELDNIKKREDSAGYGARESLRQIENCRKQQTDLVKGIVRNDKGGLLRIVPIKNDVDTLNEVGYNLDVIDNLIVLTALKIKKENSGETIFVSNDCNARIKCSLLEIPAEEHKSMKVDDKFLTYMGYQTVKRYVNYLKDNEDKTLIPLSDFEEKIEENEFVLLEPMEEDIGRKEAKKYKRLFKRKGDYLVLVDTKYGKMFGGMSPRNLEQTLALDLLMDGEIKIVSIQSQAGAGKTFCALGAALTKVLMQKNFDKILFLKPTISAHEDIGFLPGNMDEKLRPFISSFLDNFEVLRKNEVVNAKKTVDTFEKLVEKGIVEVEHIGFLRGRSLNDCFIIVDEIQNVSINEIKTIVSRVGSGSKIILLGDIDQIDRSFLSKNNNGMVHLISKFKGQSLYGHITLLKSERSDVCELASRLL